MGWFAERSEVFAFVALFWSLIQKDITVTRDEQDHGHK
jgi:hypothetical protein